MELTRRDAVAALAALGVTGGGAVAYHTLQDGDAGGTHAVATERIHRSFQAIAPVVYPDELAGIEPFVERFLDGRLANPDRAEAIEAAVVTLDDHATSWHGNPIPELPPDRRDRVLREVGANTAEEDPEGTDAERIRYHVVNELLLALYSSPTGGELVGIENPIGHPGGTESYQRGPR